MTKLYIGLDVHKASVAIGLAPKGRKEPEYYGKTTSDLDVLVRTIRRIQKKQGVKKDEVKLCYEAGPTGFVMARRFRQMGYDIVVVAPSLIPKRAGARVKTDRRDARKLAGLFRAGELTAVHVPDETDEVVRDMCRARTDAVETQMRSRLQLGAFLLRNGYRYTGKSHWCEAHLRYLRELVMQHPAQKMILEEYLQRVDTAVEQVQRFEDKMKLLLENWERRSFVEALQGLRGFQMVAAMVITSELGDLHRFDHPRQLMAYLGLVPGEYSSGSSRRQGSITKSGNSHARWILVEVARHYRYEPKINMHLSKRQVGLSREVKALSWRTQIRLHKRYTRLFMRGIHYNKIMVALARELAAFIWELARVVDQEASSQRAA